MYQYHVLYIVIVIQDREQCVDNLLKKSYAIYIILCIMDNNAFLLRWLYSS